VTEIELLAFNLVFWALSGALIGWRFATRPWQHIASPGRVTRLRSWERREWYERLLRVHDWKDALPEAGTWFGGISKRRLPDRREGGLARFSAESLRAERVHLVYLPVVLLTLAWTRGWLILVTLGFAVAVNLPCIVVARYNRIRLAHLA
jgi:glycosyl-4,4'-diaponeurosporenoate acyltransferase